MAGEVSCCFYLQGICKIRNQEDCRNGKHVELGTLPCHFGARCKHAPCMEHNAKERWEGVLKRFNPEKGFGFIECDIAREQHSCDVWVHCDQVGWLQPGAKVSFGVCFRKEDGKPQAISLIDLDSGQSALNGQPPGGADGTGSTWGGFGGGGSGKGKGKGKGKGGAVATEAGTEEEFRVDVSNGTAYPLRDFMLQYGGTVDNPPSEWLASERVDSSQLLPEKGEADGGPPAAVDTWKGSGGGSLPGDGFAVCCFFLQGKCKAHTGCANQHSRDDRLGCSFGWRCSVHHQRNLGCSSERWEGTLKNFFPQKGFGFIISPQAQAKFGVDVWVHCDQLGVEQMPQMAQPGIPVTFAVSFNKDKKPQAIDVAEKGQEWKAGAAAAAKLGFSSAMTGGAAADGPSTVCCYYLQGGKCAGGSKCTNSHDDSNMLPCTFGMQCHTHQNHNMMTMPGGVRWEGTVKSFNEKKGFGFIDSPRGRAQYSCDVYVHHTQMPAGLPQGSPVNFRVSYNKEGKPQAVDIQMKGAQPAPFVAGPYGQPMQPQAVAQAVPQAVGWVGATPGAVRATAVGRVNSSGIPLVTGTVVATPALQIQNPAGAQFEDDGFWRGSVKSFVDGNGYGFIQCARAMAEHGGDVWVSKEQIPEGLRAKGTAVKFTVTYDKKWGKPQAQDVQPDTPPAVQPVQAVVTAVSGVPAVAAEKAAAAQAAAAGALPEHRVDPSDGAAYSLQGFVVAYGGSMESPPEEWFRATPVSADQLDLGADAAAVVAQPAAAGADMTAAAVQAAFEEGMRHGMQQAAFAAGLAQGQAHAAAAASVPQAAAVASSAWNRPIAAAMASPWGPQTAGGKGGGGIVGGPAICCFFLQNKCTKGASCNWAHDSHSNAACSFGSKCRSHAQRNAAAPEDRWSGTVKSFNSEKGWGFIASERAARECQCDVWVHHAQIQPDCQPVGTPVCFTVHWSKDGKPQASDVRHTAIGAGESWETPLMPPAKRARAVADSGPDPFAAGAAPVAPPMAEVISAATEKIPGLPFVPGEAPRVD